MIDHYEHFVKRGRYDTAASILIKLDEIIRAHSIGTTSVDYDTLLSNEEAFRKRLGDFIMLVVKQNLDACTVGEGCKEYGKVGTVPKWKGQPSISHIVHEVRPRDEKDLAHIFRNLKGGETNGN